MHVSTLHANDHPLRVFLPPGLSRGGIILMILVFVGRVIGLRRGRVRLATFDSISNKEITSKSPERLRSLVRLFESVIY